MEKHPHSVWTLGGLPQGYTGVPSPADLESWGKTWAAASDDYLIGLAARVYGDAAPAAVPALIESQRRLKLSIAAFEQSARQSAHTLNDMQRSVLTAIDAASDAADKQTAEVINLTRSTWFLTWVLVAVGILQILLMFWKG
jgi:hypothetical protein